MLNSAQPMLIGENMFLPSFSQSYFPSLNVDYFECNKILKQYEILDQFGIEFLLN